MGTNNLSPITYFNGQNVEIIELYKYLGNIIDNNPSFDCNTSMFQGSLFCLRKLATFNVDMSLMTGFNTSFI